MFKKYIENAVDAYMKRKEIAKLNSIAGPDDLEQRFHALCQHLGVYIHRTHKPYEVVDNRPMTSGICSNSESAIKKAR